MTWAKERASLPAPADAAMLKEIRKKIGLAEKVAAAKEVFRGLPVVEENIARPVPFVFQTEPGILVPGGYHHAEKPRALIVYAHGLGRAAGESAIQKLVQAGNDVLAIDLRGFGDTASSAPSLKPDAKPGYFGDFRESFLGLHIGRPLLGQRAYDLLAVVAILKGDPATGKLPVHVVGVGAAGPIALHAAALDPRIEQVTVEDSVVSWESVVRTPISYNQLSSVVAGALAVYDLPELARFIAPRGLTIRGAVDAALTPVSAAALMKAYAPAVSAYSGENAAAKLRLEAN
jgi:pimeloyl-ACP methyl ester carboxylesterase